VSKATYNITDDKLRVWFDDRLPADDYKACKSAGFTFWHGSKCFVAKWSTQAEDFILSRGIVIDDDDAPDDVEARVDRFAAYADDAAQSAESAQAHLESGRANTERRKQNAINAVARNLSAAEHWQERINAAIRHAAFKERPDVIARRIKGLESDLRREQKTKAECEACLSNWRKVEGFAADPEKQRNAALLVSGRSRRTPYGIYHGLTDGKLMAAQAVEQAIAGVSEILARAERWIAHIENRLLYERAALNAAGGIPAEQGIEKGGAIKCWRGRGNWLLVTKVNKATVEVFDPSCSWQRYGKVEKTRITEIATAAQVECGEVSVVRPEPAEAAA